MTAELGVGSTFFFELKLFNADIQSDVSNAESGVQLCLSNSVVLDSSSPSSHNTVPAPLIEHQKSFKRALIVDDSKLNRKMLYRQLKNIFFDIVEVCLSLPS